MTDSAAASDPLPEQVRARVAALAADALGRLPVEELPASLRRVASFAPQRRAKLAATQINAALESDAEFRERLAVQVRAAVPDLAQAVEAGRIGAAPPVDVAALAHLLRPEGWQEVQQRALDTVADERSHRLAEAADEQVETLRAQLAQATAQAKEARQRGRAQVETLKAENADLRRRLGETRTRLREAEEGLQAAEAGRAEQAERQTGAQVAAEAESRRLLGELQVAETELSRLRRSEREGRDAATVRARLLLETLLESAQGLRRELALPAVSGSPSDQLEGELAQESARVSSGARSLPSDDPDLLEQLVSLPRARLIIDGYNVTKAAWPTATLEQQRDRLLTGVGALVARTRAETTVVFDAAETEQRPPVAPPRGVKVRFSPYGVLADDVIRELVAVEPRGRLVVVVTSDQAVVRDVARDGARTVAAVALARLVTRS